jgi:hypothetical protein
MRRSSRYWLAACLVVAVSLTTSTKAQAACAFGTSSGGEPSLQDVFTDMFGAANAPSATSDCIAEPGDALWKTVDSVGSATILVEIAGNANGNMLGIYDSSNTGNSLQLFSGPASTGSRAYITVSGTPGNYVVTVDSFTTAGNTSVSAMFGSSVFGFYINQPAGAGGQRFYSDSSLNPGINGGAVKDYMYAYQGNGATFLNNSLYAPAIVQNTQFRTNDNILAWEDLSTGSDRDYQDMTVLLRDIVPAAPPVPLPAAAWLLLSGIAILLPIVRRREPLRAA